MPHTVYTIRLLKLSTNSHCHHTPSIILSKLVAYHQLRTTNQTITTTRQGLLITYLRLRPKFQINIILPPLRLLVSTVTWQVILLITVVWILHIQIPPTTQQTRQFHYGPHINPRLFHRSQRCLHPTALVPTRPRTTRQSLLETNQYSLTHTSSN